jgi:hypothetical protein
MAKTKILICPYCGETQSVGDRCVACAGLFEPLSRQATHNAMGPWFVRNPMRPFQPGCSYETMVKMVERGQVIRTSIVRGPTSKQFWTAARRLPGIAHLLGYCHNCDASVDPGDHGCHSCGVPFGAYLDRNYLGLPEVKPLPWETPVMEDRSGAGGMRGIDWQRAAEPMGISSFASDRELRGAAGASSGPSYFSSSGASSPTAGASSSVALMEHVSSAVGFTPAAAVEAATGSAAYRALQRRMQQQRNTIRLLVVGLIALAVLAVLVLAAKLASRAPASPSPKTANPTADASSASVPPKSSATTSSPAATAPASTPAYEPRDDLRRVEELISEGQDATRSIDARIADYEQAQTLLKDVAAKLPRDRQPPDIAPKLQSIQHELEQLKLKQYFP